MGRGGGQGVSVLALYSNDPSSNPAEANSYRYRYRYVKNKANPDLFMLIFVFYNRSVDGVLGIQTWHCRWIHCAMTAQMCVSFQQGIYKADTGTTRFVSYIQPPQK